MSISFESRLRQPTTVLGIAGLVGMAAHGLAQYLTGDPSYTLTAGGIAAAAVAIVLNDNTAAASDASILAIDAVRATANHTLENTIPKLMEDTLQFLRDIAPRRPVPEPANAATVAKAALVPVILLALGIGLQACTAAQQHVGCQVDTVTVPIADAAIAGLVPTASGAVAVDAALVHPAVKAYCAALGGMPVPTTAVAAVAALPAVPPAVPAVPAVKP